MRAPRRAPHRRLLLAGLMALPLGAILGRAARAEPPALVSLELARTDEAVQLSFAVRFALSRAVEEALLKGVPLHFTAQADLYRSRWWWTDPRKASATRVWRLVYLPLTRQFRVTFGGLNQSFDALEEAIASLSRAVGWRIAEASAVDDGADHYVDFSYRLDTSLLPRPLQIGIVGQPDWTLELRRTQPLG